MRELLIMRHGKAESGVASDDLHRPLKDRGKRGAQRLGVWLARKGLVPDYIVASHAVRARETAAKCAKAMEIDARRLYIDERIYQAHTAELLEVLAACPDDAQRVLLVGHNPGLKQLLEHLADADQRLASLPTASLVRLRLADDWSRLFAGQGELVDRVNSSELPKKFPFPSPHGAELRDRPAYYYTQSAIVPYRIEQGQLEILIIRSSQNKHWVVPKGIADPGQTLQESAAKEAFEEAGVEGEVQQQAIGSYRYTKWGATCTVSVYPLRVSRMLSDDEWEESHRGRQWVSPRITATMLKQQELAELVTLFSRQFEDRTSPWEG
jgi:phosphohistidine phosphatase